MTITPKYYESAKRKKNPSIYSVFGLISKGLDNYCLVQCLVQSKDRLTITTISRQLRCIKNIDRVDNFILLFLNPLNILAKSIIISFVELLTVIRMNISLF